MPGTGRPPLILIDTHVRIWWVSNSQKTGSAKQKILEADGVRFALSIVSCWKMATRVQYGRLELDRPVQEWIESALAPPNPELLPLTPAH